MGLVVSVYFLHTFFIKMFLINIKWPSFTTGGVWSHWLTKVKRGQGIMLRIMLISMFDFQYMSIYIYIHNIYIYIYIYIYIIYIIYIFSHQGCSCYYYCYLYNCNWSFSHAFAVMCYLPKSKRGMASLFVFLTSFNITPKFLINR